MQQHIRRAELSDGTSVAYAVSGTGPPLLLMPGWVSHVELDWALAPGRRFFEALSDGRTLLRYDRSGSGLSEPVPDVDIVEREFQIIAAVLDAAAYDVVDLLGMSLSAPLAVKWAAAQPKSVRRMVLYGGWLDGARLADAQVQAHVLGLVEQHWGFGSQILTEIFAPDADAAFRTAFATLQRDAAGPDFARAMLDAGYRISVATESAKVTAPTTVIHRDGDRAAPIAEGRRLAAAIPGARLVVLPGRAHIPYVGDVDTLIDHIRAGLGLPKTRAHTAPRLTARQLQVAALVAAGMTNREVAAELVISERSAESHVERIRTRLGLRSRAQLAAWYATTYP
ncbi:LuxR C-terminal-related transcriptional regulator [Gordonia asplenii]|nr:LuxR C-terminal-related transcriptional regulator [Gordonia asplenii]